MTKITFINGKPDLKNIEGPSEVKYLDRNQFSVLDIRNDDFVLVGNVAAPQLDLMAILPTEFYKSEFFKTIIAFKSLIFTA